MTFHHHDYREIITKAICGRGGKRIQSSNQVMPQQRPSSILGCWIINHQYEAKHVSDKQVLIRGTYDINIWYSFKENSKTEVATEKVQYRDEIPLTDVDAQSLNNYDEVVASVIKQPNCVQCKIAENGGIDVEIEREFIVEVIGETKVQVRVMAVEDGREANKQGESQSQQQGKVYKK